MQLHPATRRRRHRQRSRNILPGGWTYSPLSLVLTLLVLSLIIGGGLLYWNWDNLPPRLHSLTRVAEARLFPRAPHADSVPTVAVSTAPDETLRSMTLPTRAPAIAPALDGMSTAMPAPTVVAVEEDTGVQVAPTEVAVVSDAPAQAPVAFAPVQAAMQLNGIRHEFQGWNNCGPATLGMQLSYFGITGGQATTAPVLKPDPDDKNVSPDELVAYAQSVGLGAQVVVGMDMDILKLLISNDFPVLVESWFIPEPNDEMGHYLLAKGYDSEQISFYDSYHGPNVTESIADFDHLWKVFNRTAIVVWPPDRADVARAILGERADGQQMFGIAVERARVEIESDANDKFAWFNLGSSLTGMQQYEYAAQAFDTARSMSLPWRMLWYQFEPYEAYYNVGRYQDVIDLTTSTLQGANNLEESYYWRARAYAALGNSDAARADLQRALRLNRNYAAAQEALAALP